MGKSFESCKNAMQEQGPENGISWIRDERTLMRKYEQAPVMRVQTRRLSDGEQAVRGYHTQVEVKPV